VARAVLGTAAVENPALVAWAVNQFGPERVAVGLDARDGWVRVRGWAAGTGVAAADLGRRLSEQGVRWCVFTEVARDGVGAGINVAASAALAAATGLRVIASGGLAGLDDVVQVRDAGLAGVIAGRALYEGQLDLAEALGNTALAPEGGLAGDDVFLRPPRLKELAFIRALWADPETMASVGGPVLLEAARSQRWFASMVNPGRPTDVYCLVFVGGEPVGEASFHRLDRGTMAADFNLKILAARRGRGYGRAAMRLLLDYFFNQLGGRVMTDDLALTNLVGQQALRRFGWEHDPTVTDNYRLVLTRERFNALHGAGRAG
jgi:RimJ/RimL family protein N-acetyltransferase